MKEAAPDTTRLRELAKAATSGPWFKWPETNHVCERAQHTIVAACPGKDGDKRWEWGTVHHPEADTEFIAAANPAVVLSLLDRIEELEDLVRASRAEADVCVLYGNAHHHSDALVDDQNRAVERR